MKIRHTGTRNDEKVELQMTPMIDIVFQLLIFFIMTFKIVAMEGDFNIKMPSAEPAPGVPNPFTTTPLKLILKANEDGTLKSIRINERDPFESMTELGQFIMDHYSPDSPNASGEAVEIELDCDPHLHYGHTIDAITRISGFIDNSGKVVQLIEKIKFSPPKKP